MPNPYPIEISDADGVARLQGAATFTDPGNQPGSGGSQPEWFGPFTFNKDDYNADLGEGNAGILLVGTVFPSGSLLLRAAVVVSEDVDHTNGGLQIAVGDPLVDFANAGKFNASATPYDTSGTLLREMSTQHFGSIVITGPPQGPPALLVIGDGAVAWVANFTSAPTTGAGNVWLEIATPA